MAQAVTLVPSGGIAASAVTALGAPVTPVAAGGVAMTLVSAGGIPVVLQTETGTSYDTATTTLLSAMSVQPTTTRMGQIDTLIASLKANGIWAKLDVLWVTAAHDSRAGRLNWKAPGTFTLAEVSSPTFTTDRGYTGNGTTSYLTTGWIPSTSGVNYTQNSGSILAWSRTAGQIASGIIGTGTTGTIRILPRNAADNMVYTINNSASPTQANTDGSGLFVASRTANLASQSYRNGAALGAADTTNPATTIPGAQINLLRVGGLFSTAEIAAGGLGSGLDATENANLYSALQTYMTAIGA